jgi:hypothetical protein
VNQHGEAKVVRCNSWQGDWCIPDMVGAYHINDDFRTNYHMCIRLDAGPLVKGVPNALHQSFTTREEATRVFAEEHAKGNTRIVDPDALPSVRQRARSTSSASPVTSYSITSTPRTQFSSDPGTRSDSHTSNFSRRHIVIPSQTPSSVCSDPLARSSSEPSPESLRRLQAMQAALHEDSNTVGIQSRPTTPQVPKFTSSWGASSTRVSTSTRESSQGLQSVSTASPRLYGGWKSSESNSPPSSWTPSRAVVKTPSWLAPYPRAQSSASKPDEALSPLSSVDLKLNSFSAKDHHCSQSPVKFSKLTPKQSQPGSSLAANRTPNQEPSSVGYSTIYLGSPVASQHRVSHDIDPRSPILNQSQVPELAYRRYDAVSPHIRVKTEKS